MDRVRLAPTPGVLEWRGTLLSETPMGGAAVLDTPSDHLVRIGSTERGSGQVWTVTREAGQPLPPRGSGLRVIGVGPLEDDATRLVTVGWENEGCPPNLMRVEADGQDIEIPASGDRFEFQARDGSAIRFTLGFAGCQASDTVSVAVHEPLSPDPAWDGERRLVLIFERPVIWTPASRIRLHGSDLWVDASAAIVDQGGERIVVGWPEGVSSVDLLEVSNLADRGGVPVGGARVFQAPVPPRPVPPTPVVMRNVRYSTNTPNLQPTLTASFRGDIDTCGDDGPILVFDSLGWELKWESSDFWRPDITQGYYLLPEALGPGRYTVRLLDCGGDLGSAVTFAVEPAVYPNPVRRGQALTIRDMPPGTLYRLVDATGREVSSGSVLTSNFRISIGYQAGPGLYLLRLESPDGEVVWHKVAVIQ